MAEVKIFTDGSCSGGRGPGGWAAVLQSGKLEKVLTGYVRETTSNRMEVTAAIEVLKALRFPCKVCIYTDSDYLASGFNSVAEWIANGWRICNGKPAKNIDLWEELLSVAKKHQVTIQWIPSHSGIDGNESVHTLALKARNEGACQIGKN